MNAEALAQALADAMGDPTQLKQLADAMERRAALTNEERRVRALEKRMDELEELVGGLIEDGPR